MVRASAAIAFAACLASCVRAPAHLPERTVVARREYLAKAPHELQGNLQHVKDGVWCSEDDAFSIPVIPYPDGPVTISDFYKGWGATSVVDMYDSHESVLQIVRTRIRPNWTEQDTKARVEQSVRQADEDGGKAVSTEVVIQSGRKQLQQLNTMPLYDGRNSAIYLLEGQSFSDMPHPEACRVDRHIVEHGYYFQISAVAYRVGPDRDRCKFAAEMAAWAAEYIQIGKGCGPSNPAPPTADK